MRRRGGRRAPSRRSRTVPRGPRSVRWLSSRAVTTPWKRSVAAGAVTGARTDATATTCLHEPKRDRFGMSGILAGRAQALHRWEQCLLRLREVKPGRGRRAHGEHLEVRSFDFRSRNPFDSDQSPLHTSYVAEAPKCSKRQQSQLKNTRAHGSDHAIEHHYDKENKTSCQSLPFRVMFAARFHLLS